MERTDKTKSAIKNDWKVLLLLLVLALGIFTPFVGKGFVTDDFVHIRHVQKGGNPLTISPFGIYRPVVSLSFYINHKLFQLNAFPYRITNLLLHLLVIVLLFIFTKTFTGDRSLTFLAVLAFILTPKAHTMAVNWISGRTELLMGIFSLLAIISWLQYESQHKKRYFLLCMTGYFLAVLSKENAALLPALLFFISSSWKISKKRIIEISLMFSVLGAVLLLRYSLGALMPVSGDVHYNLLIPIGTILENIINYFFRSIPSVFLLILAVSIPMLIAGNRKKVKGIQAHGSPLSIRSVLFSCIWFLMFIIPVSPIRMRSELYVYFAGFGFCILGSQILIKNLKADFFTKKRINAPLIGGLVVYILLAGAYIINGNIQFLRKSHFSNQFLQEMIRQVEITPDNNFLYIKPEDRNTEKWVQYVFQGYFDIIVKVIYNRENLSGRMAYEEDFSDHKNKTTYKVKYLGGKLKFIQELP
ncbi:MAG: glycosyltransferase family 39 protein [Candidatus Aminicenantes bacterium]|nr:glycosyltransferase family 39 protein [Candidatus Aminicenantes bacterium]